MYEDDKQTVTESGRKRLADWQERVITERDELYEKCEKLHDFLSGTSTCDITGEQWLLLQAQESAMLAYLGILNVRITQFHSGE